MSGPKASLHEGWELIRQGIKLELPVEASLYLGCMHEFSGNQSVRTVCYNLDDYLNSTVAADQKICVNLSGR